MVRLIRSKGVGVFFVTQNPSDIPESVLSQLGARIQHALRAYTPKEQKNIKAAAESFRPNPKIDCQKRITELGVGEALVSVLDINGVPTLVEDVLIKPPFSKIGPIDTAIKNELINSSPYNKKYRNLIDNESAFEKLQSRKNQIFSGGSITETIKKNSASFGKSVLNSAVRSIAGRVGRALVRGIFGNIKLG
jgi:DNA helicase HerA-like ATPase